MQRSAYAALGPDSAWTSAEARESDRTYQVRLAALVCSGISVVASFGAFYWFCRMDKLFRHRLIMLLVYGDLMRSTWYFTFAVYSLARGTVNTKSRFCQSSGFFIQYGAETSDYAVLVIAIHSALQVFHPKTRGTSDGLYSVRYYIYFGAFILPIVMASLAFINPGDAYLSQGAFCTLPIRPFWYRLALAWIPRYLIAAVILSLATAIYAYVGFEFRSYASVTQSFNTPTNTTNQSHTERDTGAAMDGAPREGEPDNGRRASSIAHDVVASHQNRRGSAVAFASDRQSLTRASTVPGAHTQSLPGSSTHLSMNRTNSLRPSLLGIPSGYSVKLEADPSSTNLRGSPLSPMTRPTRNPVENLAFHSATQESTSTRETAQPAPPAPPESPPSASALHLRRQRARIHRQLRLMFIYPLVYTFMWLIPFIQHCFNYSDRFATHPIFFLRVGTAICITSMGFVDCLIFSVREKPWRSIPTSDGTLWGSFAVWRAPRIGHAGRLVRSLTAGSVNSRTPGEDGEGIMAVTRMRSSVRISASNDFTRLAVEQARVRLDLEREERLARMRERVMVKSRDPLGTDGTESKEGSKYSEHSEMEEGGGERKGKGKGKEREVDHIDRMDWKREG